MTDPAGPSHPPPTAAPPEPPTSAPSPGIDWDRLTGLDIVRDPQTGWISGTCSGIAARYDVDPLLIRAGFIALTFTGGLGVPLYLAAWLLLPDTSGRILLREAGSGAGAPVLLVVAFVLSLVVALGFSTQNGALTLPPGLLAIVGAGVLFYYARRRRTPPSPVPPPPPGTGPVGYAAPPPAGGHPGPAGYAAPGDPTIGPATVGQATSSAPPAPMTWAPGPAAPGTSPPWPPAPAGGHAFATAHGSSRPPSPAPPGRARARRAPRGTGLLVLAIVVGASWAAASAAPRWGIVDTAWVVGLVAALAAASVCAMLLGLCGRRGGFATVLTLLLLVPALVAAPIATLAPSVTEGATQDWAPTAAGQMADIGVSDVHVDLASLPADAAGGTPLRLRVGAGTVTITIPADRSLVVTMSAGGGQLDAGRFTPPGEDRVVDGVGVERTVTVEPDSVPGTGREPVRLQVEVGVGSIVLQAAPASLPTSRSTP